MTQQTQSHHFDAIIVGGGMVGLSLAIDAASSGLDIAVIEPQLSEPQTPVAGEFSARVSAISPLSQQWLQLLGVWNRMPAARLCAYKRMSVWDGLGSGCIDFDAESVDLPELGHIVENRWLQQALLERASSLNTLRLFAGHRLANWQQTDLGISAELDDGTPLLALVLAGCDGRFSNVRQQADIRSREWQYDHTALVTSIRHENRHQATARQVFLDSGPLAFLPLADAGADQHWSSIVWSADTKRAGALQQMSDDDFRNALQQASEGCLGTIEHCDARISFPLTQMHVKNYYKQRLVLLGDAAHAIHPLAGQGVNLGFQDARALAGEWQRARRHRIDLGEPAVMRRYQRLRQSHNLAAMAAMEGFKRLFQSDQPLAVFARNLGMNQLNKLALAKLPLIRLATGKASI